MAPPVPVSPLAPTSVPDMPAIPGVKLATAAAGIKYANRTDVLLALLDAIVLDDVEVVEECAVG